MKTRIILSAALLILISIFVIFDSNQNSIADQTSITDANGSGFVVLLWGTGSTSNATVRARNTSTGVDYYAYQVDPGIYFVTAPSGTYNVFACTSYPSYGSEMGVSSDKWSEITLQGGFCPFGND